MTKLRKQTHLSANLLQEGKAQGLSVYWKTVTSGLKMLPGLQFSIPHSPFLVLGTSMPRPYAGISVNPIECGIQLIMRPLNATCEKRAVMEIWNWFQRNCEMDLCISVQINL